MFSDYCICLIDAYSSKNRLIFFKMTILILALRTYGSRLSSIVYIYYLIAVRQHFAIVITKIMRYDY